MSHHSNNQTTSGSDTYSAKPDLSGLKNNRIISSVFEGKCPSEYESAWSPTSPLDFRVFSSLGNPLSSRSKGNHKSWDSGKVGLSIVDSLDDHHIDSSRILLPSPDYGSLMRSGSPNYQKPQLPNPMVEEFPVQTHRNKDDKCNVDSCLVHAYSSGAGNNNACQVPGSLNGHTESGIQISEDYTCVISHGLNSKTTHFYGDQVSKKSCSENKKESIFVIAPPDLTTPIDKLLPNDFLHFCCNCSKNLGMGKDIYMYRGYKAFCSSECRSEEIQLDEKMEEEEEAMSGSSSDEDLCKKKSNGVIFTVG